MTTMYLAHYINEDDGVESIVVEGDYGYHVVLRDTDADETVGVIAFPSLETAKAKAESLI